MSTKESSARTTILIVAVAAAFAVQHPHAQAARPPAAKPEAAADAKATLEAAAQALGMLRGVERTTNLLNTLVYSGSGSMYAIGQAFRPDMPWPAFKVTRYTTSIGYALSSMRVDLERTNPDGVVRGGGGLPLAAPQRQIQVVNGSAKLAWNELTPGMNATPALAALTDRLVQLWTTPHGVIKAALQPGAGPKVTKERGATVITFQAAGAAFKATLNDKNLVERVETITDNPVLGDVVTETTYSGYRDFDMSDVLFPARIVQQQGGFPVLDLTIAEVRTNPYAVFEPPQNVQQAAAASPAPEAIKVETQKIADGVWYLTGGTHHSVAVEFKDHVVLVECPQNDARSLAVVETVKKTIPNKAIKYVVNTHHHFDHSGGLRACVAEGATVITYALNKTYYEKVWAMPHTVSPDRLAKSPRKRAIETVGDKRVLSDPTRVLELYRVQGSDHADTMIAAYLPKERILIEADVYTPAPANAPAGPVSKEAANLYDNIERLRLDVRQIAPIHGRLVTIDDLRRAVGKAATN